MRSTVWVLLTALATTSAALGGESGLSFETIFGESVQTAPSQVLWSPEGDRLSYVWSEAGSKGLWLLEVAAGTRREILRIAENAPGDLPALPEVERYEWAPDGTELLLEGDGKLHRLILKGGRLIELPASEAATKMAHFSPDGENIGFVRDADLYRAALGSGEVLGISSGGTPDEQLNGQTDWVYWEEIWNRTSVGYWWSPDGQRVAYYSFDVREVPSYPMVDFTGRYPEVEWQRYPTAGQTNPKVRVAVHQLADGEATWMKLGDSDAYIARVDWLPGGERLAIQRLNRDQNHLELLSCEASGGDCELMLEERAETWVNLTLDLHFLPDGNFLWTSESSGWRRLAVHDSSGRQLRILSPDGWTVTAVDGVADDGTEVFYSAYETGRLGALHRVAFRQPVNGGPPIQLSEGDAWSRVLPSPTGSHFVLWQGSASHPTRIVVRDRAGEMELDLPTRGRPGIDAQALPKPRFLTIPGPDGSQIPAALTLPPDLDPRKTYPAVMYHYGGPASQVVADRWSWRGRALWHAMMAERGFVVLRVDNLASNFFGKHGADRAHRRFGPTNLAAQRAGVDYLHSLGYVDTERVGIWGGSGGGYHTLYALMNSPGTWRAGVAFAPVTDWYLYDTIWTERYLDHPDDNVEGYRDSSPVNHAERLEDRLLIVHGTADDNVHPQNTLVMAHALNQAGKSFEMAIHPRQKHGFRGQDLRHFYERMTEFFDRHLAPRPQD